MEAVFPEVLPVAKKAKIWGRNLAVATGVVAIASALIVVSSFFVRLAYDVSAIRKDMPKLATKNQLDNFGNVLYLFINDVAELHSEIKPSRYQWLLSPVPQAMVWPAEGQIREWADGIEIIPQRSTQEGTPVQSVWLGTVASARDQQVVLHWSPPEGSTSAPDSPVWSGIYQNVSDISVEEGQTVKAGEVIGSFTCGEKPDECLHFSVKRDDYLVDARAFLPLSLQPVILD